MKHEEQGQVTRGAFYKEGNEYQRTCRRRERRLLREMRRQSADDEEPEMSDDTELEEGKRKREELKARLLEYLDS